MRGRPSSFAAVSTSPSAAGPRGSRSTRPGGRRRSPARRRRRRRRSPTRDRVRRRTSGSPAPPRPKRKSAPTITVRTCSASTRTRWTNSRAVRAASSASKRSTRVASMPVSASSCTFWCTPMRSSGQSSGRSSASGLRSKVTATTRAPPVAASTRARSSTARCPECTPSNLPIATTDGPKPSGTSEGSRKTITAPPRGDGIRRRRALRTMRREPPDAEERQHERHEQVPGAEPRPHGRVGEQLGQQRGSACR